MEVVRRVVGDDGRFVVERNERNVGFYSNFEKVLKRVPGDCELVTLCDQDDRWYPEKLARLAAEFGKNERVMVYSDMRIAEEDGRVLSDTYWLTRPNNYTDIESLFFANTITGAASMFRAELLEWMLPFPPRRGTMFHDWWMAMVAMAAGEIGYVDEPLYDYIQHGGNVVGWSQGARRVKLWELGRRDYRRKLVQTARRIYEEECRNLAASIATLELRMKGSGKAEAIGRLVGILERPVWGYFKQSMRAEIFQRASVPRETNVFMAVAVTRMMKGYRVVRGRWRQMMREMRKK
jgi:glycosyltransferase involved in cell wall biosynthesis